MHNTIIFCPFPPTSVDCSSFSLPVGLCWLPLVYFLKPVLEKSPFQHLFHILYSHIHFELSNNLCLDPYFSRALTFLSTNLVLLLAIFFDLYYIIVFLQIAHINKDTPKHRCIFFLDHVKLQLHTNQLSKAIL